MPAEVKGITLMGFGIMSVTDCRRADGLGRSAGEIGRGHRRVWGVLALVQVPNPDALADRNDTSGFPAPVRRRGAIRRPETD